MKKKILFVLLLAVILVVALAGCKKQLIPGDPTILYDQVQRGWKL